MVMPRSLNEPVGLAPSTLSQTSAPTRAGQAGGGDQRGPPFQQGDDRRVGADGKEWPVLLHDALPARAHAYSSSPMTRSTPPTRSTACKQAQLVDGRQEIALAGHVGEEDQTGLVAQPDLLHGPDRHLVVAEHLGHGGENPEPLGHVHAEIEGRAQLGLGSHRDARPLGRRRRGAGAEVAGGIDQVAQHGAGGRFAAGPAAVEHELAAHRALDEHRVERAPYRGQRVGLGHHGGVHPDRELGTAVDQLGHGQKLDGVAQAVGVGHVDRSDSGDPLAVDIDIDHVAPEGQRGQDRRLRGGVVSLDIGRGIALGQAEALRLGQRVGEVDTVLFHPGQDEVRRAVDDAHDAHDLLAGERLAQGPHNRDGARHRGFVEQVDAAGVRQLGQLGPRHGQDGLVGRHHRFAGAQGGLDELAGPDAGRR